MMEVTAYAVVPAPPDQVWELVCDTSRYAEWVEGTDEVTRTDGPAAPGSTYDEVNPILGPWKAKTHWTVTEFEAPRRMVHRGTGLPLTEEFDVIFELAPEGDSTGLHADPARQAGARTCRRAVRPPHGGAGRARQPEVRGQPRRARRARALASSA